MKCQSIFITTYTHAYYIYIYIYIILQYIPLYAQCVHVRATETFQEAVCNAIPIIGELNKKKNQTYCRVSEGWESFFCGATLRVFIE